MKQLSLIGLKCAKAKRVPKTKGLLTVENIVYN